MNLIEIIPGAYYLPGAVNIGVVITPDGGALLIDTGQDKDYARRVLKACQSRGLEPRAIINTHAHADHFGGNDYLTRNLDLPVYAPPFEEAVLRYPYLEPFYLFSGARPIPPLQTKWLMAKPSPVDHVIRDDTLEIEGVSFQVLSLPGHAQGQIALTWGQVCYCSDALFGQEVLAKYGVPFATDVARQIESIERLWATDYAYYLPAHGGLVTDVEPLAQANLAYIQRAAEAVLAAVQPPAETTQVVARVCQTLGLSLDGIPQYYLFKSVVKAYLSYLVGQGQVEPRLEDNRLLWRAI